MMGFFLAGVLMGFVVMAMLAAKSYDRGYKDCKKELPEDINNYLNDQI